MRKKFNTSSDGQHEFDITTDIHEKSNDNRNASDLFNWTVQHGEHSNYSVYDTRGAILNWQKNEIFSWKSVDILF